MKTHAYHRCRRRIFLVIEYLSRHPSDEGGSFTSVNALLLAKEGKSQETEKMIARVALPNIARPGAWVMIQELRADR